MAVRDIARRVISRRAALAPGNVAALSLLAAHGFHTSLHRLRLLLIEGNTFFRRFSLELLIVSVSDLPSHLDGLDLILPHNVSPRAESRLVEDGNPIPG